MQLRIAQEYVKQFGKLADEASGTLIVPAILSDISSMIAMATSVVKWQNAKDGWRAAPINPGHGPSEAEGRSDPAAGGR